MIDFLFTTSKTVSIYKNGKIKDLFLKENNKRIYGLTWDENIIYSLHHEPKTNAEHIHMFCKKSLKHLGILNIPIKISGGHQIFYYKNLLYVVNTDKNLVSIVNPKNKKLVRNIKWRGNSTKHHINSIWCDGKKLYVCEHNGGRANDNIMPSCIQSLDMDFKNLHLYKNIGKHTHNIYIEDGCFIVCSSIDSKIVRYDIKTQKAILRKPISALNNNAWYVRGLARTSDKWIVGLSYRKKRQDRPFANRGGIIILDNNFNVLKEIPINNYGQIFEIRAISELDKAHNGIPF